MVPADSRRIPRAPRYSGYRYGWTCFGYQAITVCGGTFQILLLASLRPMSRSYNPAEAGTSAVWALPRSLATTGGITVCFLFLRVLRCFSSPGSPPLCGCEPGAYRSLSRPSSPSRAKASAMRPFLLSLELSSRSIVTLLTILSADCDSHRIAAL